MRRHRPTKKRAEVAKSSRGSESNDECLDLVEIMDDRVELLQQAFKCLRTRELLPILPEAMKNRPVTNVKEECLEELLGISSKRLRAILNETVPPSDTESSSDDQEAAISLESISSDESNLNTVGDSKKKRHKNKESKKRNKKKGRKGRSETPEAERKNFTVLELLELTARARAIRAQLHKEPAANQESASGSVTQEASAGEDDDVVIKEEPPVVVELSSDDDEKPDLVALEKTIKKATKKSKEKEKDSSSTTSETCTIKKKNDLTIITPKKKISKRIKLRRVKFAPKFVKNKSTTEMSANENSGAQEQVAELKKSAAINEQSEESGETKAEIPVPEATSSAAAAESNKKTKKKKRTKTAEGKAKEDSDKDEITLQLSDTEKMDLLEDNYPKKQKLSSNTEDSGLSTSEEEPSAGTVCVPPETPTIEVESDKAEASNTELQLQPTIELQQIPTIKITESESQEPIEHDEILEIECEVPNEPDIGNIEMETPGPSFGNTESESQLIANENSSQGPFADISSDERPAEVADELEPSISYFDVVLEKESSNDSGALQIQEESRNVEPDTKLALEADNSQEQEGTRNVEPVTELALEADNGLEQDGTRNVEPDTELALEADNGQETGPNITQVVEDTASITQQVNPAVEPVIDIDENATPQVLTAPKPKVYLKYKNQKYKKGKK